MERRTAPGAPGGRLCASPVTTATSSEELKSIMTPRVMAYRVRHEDFPDSSEDFERAVKRMRQV
ncbi:hypothetical protein [Streptomyces sp. NBC_01508]|uniref:hypothetical protein n=1 Tax=Streptomyces sp. NBC_01508 TaxID=2903888 RepID=UPI00386AE0FE